MIRISAQYRRMQRTKMLFKLGLTLIVGVALYMYYALKETHGKYDHLKNIEYSSDKDEHITVNVLNEKPVTVDNDTHVYDKTSDNIITNSHDAMHGHINAAGDKSTNGLSQRRSDANFVVKERKSPHWLTGLHLLVVVCGERMEESLVMLKSAVLFSRSLLVFHIFTEDRLHVPFKEQLDFWPPSYREKVEYHIYNLSFPFSSEQETVQWKQLFKPCASQRLFIPNLLADVDALLYVDTDVLFLSPIDEIWMMFSLFNTTQMAAVAPEHEDAATGWYNRFARHPYYGELGINSGIVLMNLTRIRESDWITALLNYFKEYRLKITFGDQDLINIYFHFYPHQLYVFGCEWNYRPDHCMYMSVCPLAEVTGAYLLHGSRRVWHENKQPGYKAVYTAFKEHRLGSSIQYDLLESLNSHLDAAKPSNCGKLRHVFTKQIETYINKSAAKRDR